MVSVEEEAEIIMAEIRERLERATSIVVTDNAIWPEPPSRLPVDKTHLMTRLADEYQWLVTDFSSFDPNLVTTVEGGV